ncbi:MAG: aminotransferase class I/II-fold pyridoxal phosphate-dependent enzyme, partial [Syntrophobacteraceae bacterium]
VPIYQSSTFIFPSAADGAARFAGEDSGYIYTRLGNPTVHALEENIAALENGYAGIATSTGMAAISSIFLAFLNQGDHVVATNCIYGPSRVMLEKELARFGVQSTFVDSSEVSNVDRAVRPETKMIYIESPMNPSMGITDLGAVGEIAARHKVLFAVDNTFASPYLQRPLELGADLVVHSLTKFINGHSDVVGGMIVTGTEEHYKKLKRIVTTFGGTMDPHQAWLVLRGVKTMPLRIEKAQESAMNLALFLAAHPKVIWVRYPGLPDHPQHEIAKKQMDGFGTMISFGVVNGLEGGITLMNGVRLITLAVSLGGVESLIEHPASMTHASIPREQREEAGILDELVRFSVGCEDFEDLRDDLDEALGKIRDEHVREGGESRKEGELVVE